MTSSYDPGYSEAPPPKVARHSSFHGSPRVRGSHSPSDQKLSSHEAAGIEALQAESSYGWLRIERTGSTARVIAWILCVAVFLCFVVGPFDWADLGGWIWIPAGAVIVLIRSMFFGVYVSDTRVKVVSWYWTYRVDRNVIRSVELRNYNGWVIRWSGAIDGFTGNVLMITLVLQSGRERNFPATSMWHSKAKPAADDLREMLGLEHVPALQSRKRRRGAAETTSS